MWDPCVLAAEETDTNTYRDTGRKLDYHVQRYWKETRLSRTEILEGN